jgi:hypothetical protein
MEYVIGVISLIILGTNIAIYRRITASYPVGVLEELDPVTCVCGALPGETCRPGCDPRPHCCCEAVIEHLNKPVETDIEVNVKPKNPEAYSAWVNRTGIPMVPPTKKPEPIVKPPKRAPLARPDGFV